MEKNKIVLVIFIFALNTFISIHPASSQSNSPCATQSDVEYTVHVSIGNVIHHEYLIIDPVTIYLPKNTCIDFNMKNYSSDKINHSFVFDGLNATLNISTNDVKSVLFQTSDISENTNFEFYSVSASTKLGGVIIIKKNLSADVFGSSGPITDTPGFDFFMLISAIILFGKRKL